MIEQPRNSPARRLLVAAALGSLSGGLCVLCVTPWNVWPLAPIAFAPLFLACRQDRYSLGLMSSTSFGLTVLVGCLHYVLPAIHRMAHLSWVVSFLIWMLIGLSQGLCASLAVLVTQWCCKRYGNGYLVFPATWVLAEKYLPVMFPWPAAILGQAYTPWLQLAELGGPLLVSAWIVASGVGVGTALAKRREGLAITAKRLTPSFALVLVVTGAGQYLKNRAERAIAQASPLHLGLVQGAHLRSEGNDNRDTLQRYRQTTLAMVHENPSLDLVIWPESILLAAVPQESLQRQLQNYVRRDRREGFRSEELRVPVLLGLTIARHSISPAERAAGATSGPRLTNSAVLLSGDGAVAGQYDKQVLMPIGEAPIRLTVPGLGDWEWIPPVTRYESGPGEGSLRLGARAISAAICYEDLLWSHVRTLAHAHNAALLVSLSSDSWFVGEHARDLHFMLASLRAVENRRYLVRATRDGLSGLVSPTGETVGTLEPHVLANGVFTAQWMTQRTSYQALGDAPIVLLALLGVALNRVRFRRSPSLQLASVARALKQRRRI